LRASSPRRSAKILFVRSHTLNFRGSRLNLLRIQRSAKHGPRIRKAPSPTAAHPGQHPHETSCPRAARYAVSVRRPPAPSGLARGPRPADRQLCRRGRQAPQTRQPHCGSGGRGGGNFLIPEIAHRARRETAYREIGALIDAERLATNSICWRPGGTHSNASPAISASFVPAFTGSAQEGLQQPVSKVMPCRPPYRDRILDR
jgi:hypothetical protein